MLGLTEKGSTTATRMKEVKIAKQGKLGYDQEKKELRR
jgi:hypothetical protein